MPIKISRGLPGPFEVPSTVCPGLRSPEFFVAVAPAAEVEGRSSASAVVLWLRTWFREYDKDKVPSSP
jgi:hypothetical protein